MRSKFTDRTIYIMVLILELAGQGHTAKAIAGLVGLCRRSVMYYLATARRVYGAGSRAELLKAFTDRGAEVLYQMRGCKKKRVLRARPFDDKRYIDSWY